MREAPLPDRKRTKTGYHLLTPEALPQHFWQSSNEDQEIIARLTALADSMQSYGLCWIIWNVEQQILYEQRDIYRCTIVPIDEYDILDRAIPYGDLRERESLPIFFSSQQFKQILETSPHKPDQPVCKTARAFLTGRRFEEEGNGPLVSVEVTVPVAAFCAVAERAKSGAAMHGKHVVTLHSSLLYLKAALFSLHQRLQQETDRARRQAFVHQLQRLQQMRDIRSEWMRQHKQYVSVSHHFQDTYIVRVGLHSSLVQEAA